MAVGTVQGLSRPSPAPTALSRSKCLFYYLLQGLVERKGQEETERKGVRKDTSREDRTESGTEDKIELKCPPPRKMSTLCSVLNRTGPCRPTGRDRAGQGRDTCGVSHPITVLYEEEECESRRQAEMGLGQL